MICGSGSGGPSRSASTACTEPRCCAARACAANVQRLLGEKPARRRGGHGPPRAGQPSQNRPLWDAVIGNSRQASQCGWCKDRWGVSWQITPRALIAAISDPDSAAAIEAARVTGYQRRSGHHARATLSETSQIIFSKIISDSSHDRFPPYRAGTGTGHGPARQGTAGRRPQRPVPHRTAPNRQVHLSTRRSAARPAGGRRGGGVCGPVGRCQARPWNDDRRSHRQGLAAPTGPRGTHGQEGGTGQGEAGRPGGGHQQDREGGWPDPDRGAALAPRECRPARGADHRQGTTCPDQRGRRGSDDGPEVRP